MQQINVRVLVNIAFLLLALLFCSAKGATNQSTRWQQKLQNYGNYTIHEEQELTERDSQLEDNFADHLEPHLTRTSVIFGLTKVVNGSSNVNAVCQAQLRHVQRGILSKQPWAMKGGYRDTEIYIHKYIQSIYRSLDQLCLIPSGVSSTLRTRINKTNSGQLTYSYSQFY